MLALHGVTKRYGSLVALNNVSLEIPRGEFFGLLGPNGAGKSTLMSLVAGLRTPEVGEVRIDGEVLRESAAAARRQIGLVPQSVALYEDLSAEQNLKIFGQLNRLKGAQLRARVDAVLEAAKLTDRRRDRVKSFSGGMQRRLNLAATLLHEPSLLLCDEPTVGVDPQSRNAIFEHLRELNRAGVTIVYSTHYMEEAERLCSRIGIIDHGQLLAIGSLDVLLQQLPFQDEITFPVTPTTEPLLPLLPPFGEVSRFESSARFRPRPDYPLSAFFAQIERLGLPARLFTCSRPSLEALFLHLTGRQLRD